MAAYHQAQESVFPGNQSSNHTADLIRYKMDIIFDIASTPKHFEQILQLQQNNVVSILSEEQQTRQGFVSVEHTHQLLQSMSNHLPQVIALSNGSVIGYNLAMPVTMLHEVPLLAPMFLELERIQYKSRPLAQWPCWVGGQVCVHERFRGRGLLSKLYHEVSKRVPSDYTLCVTEVAQINIPSLHAHHKMGFETVNTYHDGNRVWEVVVWDPAGPRRL